MWPFKSVKSFAESGIFSGFTDCHSHILPGVDDGIKTIEDSLEVLKFYDELGVKKVWLTPHVMEDYPNSTDDLRKKFDQLKSQWEGSVEIKLASENMLDSLFEERLSSDDFLPIGDEGDHLLVETSYYTPPMGMYDMLEEIKKRGYFPILAHPERYRYMEAKDYLKLKEAGILFQMNFVSIVGGYGEAAKKKAEWLLSKDMVDFTGSDLHNIDTIKKSLSNSPGKKILLDKLQSVALQNNKL